MTVTTLKLKGMSCASCANSIERAIQQVPGVSDVRVNFAAEQASVEYNERDTSLEKIQAAVADAGYEASAREELGIGEENAKEQEARTAQQRSLLYKVIVSGVIGVVLILGTLPMMIGWNIQAYHQDRKSVV